VNAPVTTGPLAGLRVIEMAGIGPAPFAAMVMADMGADVLRVERPSAARGGQLAAHMGRGRRSVALDLKHPAAAATLLDMIGAADVLIEGFRPGVMERFGLGPEVCLARNGALVYGRITGWGQDGPLAQTAGHDINYIAIAGVLGSIGTSERPVVPVNLVGDFGGGGMLLLAGVMMALFERSRSGRGQVVDAAMVDGAGLLATLIHELVAEGAWSPARRGGNLLDGGAPFYAVYETSDHRYVAVGALEPQFFAELIRVLGVDFDVAAQHDPASWPELRRLLTETFGSHTRDEWTHLFEGTDACVSPVLDLAEATVHAQAVARRSYVDLDGHLTPGPAPAFSRTPGAVVAREIPGEDDTAAALRDWGVSTERIAQLLASGAAVQRARAEDDRA
jgi:alpha-methylacyl-CoA racemase